MKITPRKQPSFYRKIIALFQGKIVCKIPDLDRYTLAYSVKNCEERFRKHKAVKATAMETIFYVFGLLFKEK